MITDIPASADFESNGLAFLNLAWDSVTNLSLMYRSLKATRDAEFTPEDELKLAEENYWQNSQAALATAVALAHQGGEFLLKSRIAEVSPFLLLYVEKWPGNLDGGDKSFADFRTVDAQELVKIHDTVCANPLPAAFKSDFDSLRKLRNTIMHSVHRDRPFTPRDGILAILEIAHTLVGEGSWQALRSKYQEDRVNTLDPFNYSEFNPLHPHAEETLHVINEVLTPAEALKYYAFNRRQRLYLCTVCHESYADDYVWSVQLKPASPTSTEAFCVACQTKFEVERRDCQHCEGNVLTKNEYDEWTCLSCNETDAEDDDPDATEGS